MTTSALPASEPTDRDASAADDTRAPRPSPPLARYLVALVGVTVVPLLLLATALIWQQASQQQRAGAESLQETANALSFAVDARLASYVLLLQTLAASEHVDRGDFAALHAYAKRVADAQGAAFISMFEAPRGRHVFNTRLPYGSPLPDPFSVTGQPPTNKPPTGDVTSLQRVFASGTPSNSDLFWGLAAQRLLFTVDVPVVRQGKVVAVINIGLEPAVLGRLIAAEQELREVRGTIVDRRGFVVARWQDTEKHAGTRAPADTLSLIEGEVQGSGYTHTLEGDYLFRAFRRSPVSGWTVLVSADAPVLLREQRQTWLLWGAAAAAALLLSLAAAARLARGLNRSIVGLERAAGGDVPPQAGALATRELDSVRNAIVAGRAARDAARQAREAMLVAEARRGEAEAANREKDRFMAAVVHEVRNPLGALANVVTLLKSGVADERVTGIVERQVGQLARLVDDLLETSRLQVGKFQLQVAPLDLRDAIREAVEATSARHRHKNQTVEVQCPEMPVMVDGDRARLVQVVANLVDNAMKFSPVGGKVRIGLATHVGHAVLTVIDSGCGIDPQFLPHVFDRFTQAPGTPGATEGLGLGLAVARDLVLAHRGRIEAASEGTGARFSVTLPLAAPSA